MTFTIKFQKQDYNKLQLITDPYELRTVLGCLYISDMIIEDLSEIFNCSEDIIISTLIEDGLYKTKLCTGCNRLLHHDEFNRQNNKKSKLSSTCRYCRKNHDTKFYKQNRDSIIEHNTAYMAEYITQPDVKIKRQEYMKNYEPPIESKAKRQQYIDEYWQDPINRQKRNDRNRIRRQTDLEYRLRCTINARINQGLHRKQGSSITEFLPYTFSELKEHLEKKFSPNMNWDNYGTYWEIDHIKPVSSFTITSLTCDDFISCWSLSNLQPLEKSINRQKWDTISEEWNNV